MKTKWNWLDTVIVCVVVVVLVGVCIFLFGPKNKEISTNSETDYYITFDTEKANEGTYDALKAGDIVYSVDNGNEFGVIETIEMIPNETAVFNETTKQYSLAKNTAYPICRITIKTTGYKNDSGEIYAKNRSVVIDDDWFMETDQFRFSAKVTGAKGASDK